MTLPNGPYNPAENEKEMLNFWLDNKMYKPEYDPKTNTVMSIEEMKKDSREPWALICPPPNAYARPHIGNISGYAYQDAMARYQRMKGKKVLVLPGKDHAGLEGEGVFVREVLEKQGRSKFDMKREDFYKMIWEFNMDNKARAMKDEQRIGLSADFDRDIFTLDPRIVDTVLSTFVDMYKAGMIYKGVRIVNWDPKARTAVADNQVEYKETVTPFYYFKYSIGDAEPEAIRIKNEFQGKDIEWTFERNKTKDGKEELPFAFGKKDDLEVIGVGYTDIDQLQSLKGKAIGILMRLNKQFRLVVLNPEFQGDLQSELSKIFLFEAKHYAGAHIILFEEYPDDKFYTNGFIIGTVRPETIFGDTAIAVDPKDERYKEFVGKEIEIEFMGKKKKLNFIEDYAVDKDFGTGVLKITPAHSNEDWEIAQRHAEECLPAIQVIGYDLKLNKLTGEYSGLGIKEARVKMQEDMKIHGNLVWVDEKYQNRIKIAERTKAPIEPLLSSQWYLKYDGIKEAAINMVKEGDVKIHPDNMVDKFNHWMENLRDWAISRSLWWGYRLPVWYAGEIKEEIDENGMVKEKIKINEDWVDLDYTNPDHLRVQLESPDIDNGKLILIPGKHGYAHRELYPKIKQQFSKSIAVTDEDIDSPSAENYQKALSKVTFNKDDVVLAHSLGCRAVIRHMMDNNIHVKHLILLAPGARLKPREDGKDANYVDLITNTSGYENIGNHVEKITVIYSDNDEIISKEAFEKFVSLLGNKAQGICESNKGHYCAESYTSNSEALTTLLNEYTQELNTTTWIQDENVLDTWFSSGQWVYATLGAYDLMDTFFPTNALVSAHDILENWDSRMMMFTYFKTKNIPFENLFLTGLVLGTDGQKMSKSKGNIIDMDKVTQEYGTDAVRMTFFYQNRAGANYAITNDKLKNFKQFMNKIWNASKFVITNFENSNVKYQISNQSDLKLELSREIIDHITNLKTKITKNLDEFEFGHATDSLYQEFWHTFCDIYIEKSKPYLLSQKNKETGEIISEPNLNERNEMVLVLIYTLKEYLKMLHPFIPFITERIWKELPKNDTENDSIMYSMW
jgi:valyl-tRNA synthetase